jgi:hypothetical protein
MVSLYFCCPCISVLYFCPCISVFLAVFLVSLYFVPKSRQVFSHHVVQKMQLT